MGCLRASQTQPGRHSPTLHLPAKQPSLAFLSPQAPRDKKGSDTNSQVMPKKKPTDLVLDESVIREAEMARTLDEQFEEGYAALKPIPEEQLPLTAARMLYYLGALWGFLKRLKPEDLAPDYEMTVEELSAFLPEKPAVQTIYGWVSEEKIPYIKRGKRLFFVKRAIIRWNTDGRPVNPDNITEIAQAYVANNRPGARKRR